MGYSGVTPSRPVKFHAPGEHSSLPVEGTKMVLQMITTLDKPAILGEGRTGRDGILKISLVITILDFDQWKKQEVKNASA